MTTFALPPDNRPCSLPPQGGTILAVPAGRVVSYKLNTVEGEKSVRAKDSDGHGLVRTHPSSKNEEITIQSVGKLDQESKHEVVAVIGAIFPAKLNLIRCLLGLIWRGACARVIHVRSYYR